MLPTVEQVGPLTWRAASDEGGQSELRGWLRPDGRCVLSLSTSDRDATRALLAAASMAMETELLVSVRPENRDRLAACVAAGFRQKRTEVELALDPRRALAELGDTAALPHQLAIHDADTVDLDRLRLLDDALRQDVPGTDGWCWSAEEFEMETTGPHADPRLYAVAVEEPLTRYAGLCRVWSDGLRPSRLGMIGVTRQWRGRGVAAAMLSYVLSECAVRHHEAITLSVDTENVPSMRLFESIGAVRTGVRFELSGGVSGIELTGSEDRRGSDGSSR